MLLNFRVGFQRSGKRHQVAGPLPVELRQTMLRYCEAHRPPLSVHIVEVVAGRWVAGCDHPRLIVRDGPTELFFQRQEIPGLWGCLPAPQAPGRETWASAHKLRCDNHAEMESIHIPYPHRQYRQQQGPPYGTPLHLGIGKRAVSHTIKGSATQAGIFMRAALHPTCSHENYRYHT